MDARARLMTDTGKHIFVPDTKNQDSVTDAFIPFGEYIHIMKLGKGSNKYNSEICVPIKYKDFVLFGYIQILHLEKMNVNDYNLVLQVASKISKDFMESGIFNDSKFKATIMDISSNGFSVSHPQSKNFGKIFSIGGTIIFDMFEEENNLGTFRAVVRNIKPLEKLFRIGCQFFHASEENTIIEELMKKYFTEGQEKENTNSTEDKQNTKTGITDPKIKADLTQPVKD